jgi:hypothetical protein
MELVYTPVIPQSYLDKNGSDHPPSQVPSFPDNEPLFARLNAMLFVSQAQAPALGPDTANPDKILK